ncbi:multi antimicrobial extrusion protein MatE [Cohnella sp. CFH 77786]|uniref:multi antimicrobial extrusion protein MatE n=1 Tax=Cohnella sp. CFH 77786 TaxID=2662265 RepID=UPI001C609BFE|nr:multi antimicrobial extrusion protein MatE [Cohnella sp. CFH 77786]MBW5445068.1 multi antimicrobial extrusion protein MatE [Cohnella sp. CFH 77786]
MKPSDGPVTMRRLFLFFIPMGLSVVLINLSHVIINGTLARAPDPETILAGYALGMSLLAVTERPAVLLRQTCSALVRDRTSFRAVRTVAFWVFGSSLVFGALTAYSPVGHWVFGVAFGADAHVRAEAVRSWQALMFLSVFSGLRCLFQGVIIYRMRTKWLTVGMVFRLTGMVILSQLFIRAGITTALQGAVIFVFGMIIEATLSWIECRRLVKQLPDRAEESTVAGPKQVLPFYNPLLFSSLIVVWVMPILNAVLGTTERATLAIASFAVAGSLMNLMLGFFTYFHQIALHFGKTDPGQVRRFTLALGFVPAVFLVLLAYTPAGPWMLAHALGVRGDLLEESLLALRGFLPFVLAFPWLDTLNGFVMSRGETKLMFGSQLANASVTALLVAALAAMLPHWSGILGSLAQSGGLVAELALLSWMYRRNRIKSQSAFAQSS